MTDDEIRIITEALGQLTDDERRDLHSNIRDGFGDELPRYCEDGEFQTLSDLRENAVALLGIWRAEYGEWYLIPTSVDDMVRQFRRHV